MDDEYFRLMLTTRDAAYNHPAAQEVWRRAMSRLSRPQSAGFKHAFLDTVREIELKTPAGIFLGTAGAYDVDFERLEVVASRIARGLFYHEIGRRLPSNCYYRAFVLERFDATDLSPDSTIGRTVRALSELPHKDIGQGVFRYKWSQVADADRHPNTTAWLFSFYESTLFLASTVDPN